MKSVFFALIAVLLIAGCASPHPSPPAESFTEQMDREHHESEARAKSAESEHEVDRYDYVAAHSELKPTLRDAILNRQVVIGMTEDQAWKSLGGKGHDYHSVVTANGRAEEWTYQDLHLIFVDGVLTQIMR